MPSSNSLLDNRYFRQLAVNRLEAQAIQSDNISSQTPSYLFSAVFDNATFDRNSTGGTLTIDSNFINSIVRFSDRPLRLSAEISFDDFIYLFNPDGSESNSFAEDPPNAVLVHQEEQRTYIVRESLHTDEFLKLSLELLPGETHNMNTVNGYMNLFVDGLTLKESLQDKISSLEVNKYYKITSNESLLSGQLISKTTYGKYLSSDDSNYNFSRDITISKNGYNVKQYIYSTLFPLGILTDIQQISSSLYNQIFLNSSNLSNLSNL